MAQSVNIKINGQTVDFLSLENLPFELEKVVDRWEDTGLVGTEGVTANSLARRLVLPATERNRAILDNPDDWRVLGGVRQSLFNYSIEIDGIAVALGQCFLTQGEMNTQAPNSYTIEIVSGNGTDVIVALGQIKLNGLDLGTINTTQADQIATWTDITDTNSYPVVFAPMGYGAVGERFVLGNQFSFFTYHRQLRPHVRVWRILEAIFEKALGYRIASDLYQSESFRNALYVFGVGDDWKRADAVNAYAFLRGAYTTQTVLQNGTLSFPNDTTAPYSDPSGMFTTATAFDASNGIAGTYCWYQFQFFLPVTGADSFDLIGVRIDALNPTGVEYLIENYGNTPSNPYYETEPLLFQPNNGLTRLIIRVKMSGASALADSGRWWRGAALDRYAYGAPLLVSSCLHEKSAKDFLRGIAHLYDLAFFFNPVLKQVYFEPRWVNHTIANTDYYPTDTATPFYFPPEKAIDLPIDAAAQSFEQKRIFGDTLLFRYASDSGDAVWQNAEDTALLSGGQYDLCRVDMAATGKNKTTESPNPFFYDLLNVRSGTPYQNPIVSGLVLPCVVQSLDILIAETEEYNYSIQPRIAMYYGNLNFAADLNPGGDFQVYVSIERLGAGSTLFAQFPVMFQTFPDEPLYISKLAPRVPLNLCYADKQYPVSGITVRGQASKFYWRYAYIQASDYWILTRAKMPLTSFLNDDFRRLRIIDTGTKRGFFVPYKQSKFKPLKDDTSTFEAILYVDPSDDRAGQIQQFDQNLTWNISLQNYSN